MVSNNKVLTVSYGTFSCTLEGFDDSFGAMKAIAEYFRDLAADDRYFGAEPPTPDADMLSRIAEREIERRVQARTEKGAIVLSVGEALDAQAGETASPAAVPAEPYEDETVTPFRAEQPQPIADPVPEAAPEPEVEAVEPAAETSEVDVQPAEAEETAVAAEPAIHEPEAVEPLKADASKVEEEAPIVMDEAPTEEVTVADVQEEVAPEQPAQAEDTIPGLSDLIAQDTFASHEVATPNDVQTDDAEPVAEAMKWVDEVEAAEQVTSSVSFAEDEGFATAEDVEETLETETPAPENSIAAKLARIRDVVSRSRAETDEEPSEEDAWLEEAPVALKETVTEKEPATTEPTEDIAQEAIAETPEEAPSAITPEEAPEEPVSMEPVARVVRMKRTDFEEAIAAGLLEAEEVADDEPSGGLSAEDEAELLAELAKVEAELLGDAPVADAAQAEPAGAQILAETQADLSRLMAEADEQMQEPEGNMRRQSIQHLRAAVAAKRAEQAIGGELDEADDTEARFRDDLAMTVKPRAETPAQGRSQAEAPFVLGEPVESKSPAVASEADDDADIKPRRGIRIERSAAPEASDARPTKKIAPTPLKLVASQRVDNEDSSGASEEPSVRPRRVERTDQADKPKQQEAEVEIGSAAGQFKDFAEYAEAMGAKDYPSLYESAAAYSVFVESKPSFTRPYLMRTVQAYLGEEFQRDEGLRAFGGLLRHGKIRKIAPGRFIVAPEIEAAPVKRAAG